MNDDLDNQLIEALTQRETEVLDLLGQGFSNREIAESLVVEISTVKWFNTQIFGKLNVKKRRQAVLRAKQLGLLGQDQAEIPLKTIPFSHTNLPAQTTPFIGRQSALDELNDLLNDEAIRLITIVATGGMGKTRLSIEVAQRQLKTMTDGVFFVDLSTIDSSGAILTVINTALGVQFQQDGRDPIQQIGDYLRGKRLVLILDNFEHVIEGAGIVGQLLMMAPLIKIIVTSRERLNLSGEHVFPLKGLDYTQVNRLDDAYRCEALQLLMQSAKQGSRDFALTVDNLPDALRICHLTEGLPLGIILAMAWVNVLSLGEIADEIEQGIDILASQPRDLPRRQHSIRAIFDYTWRRLSPEEQDGVADIAFFRGGCTREAAQTITRISLPVLMYLSNRALLWRDTETGRYYLHHLLRQYAQEKLHQSTRIDDIALQHSRYYLAMLAEHEDDLKGTYQIPALDEIESDFDNIRIAWHFAVQRADYELLNEALESLRLYCTMKGLIQERKDLLSSAWEQLGESQPLDIHPLLSRLLVRVHRDEAQICLTLAQSRQDELEVAYCLYVLGYIALGQRQFSEAIEVLEASIEIYRRLNDLFYVGRILSNLGFCYLNIGQQNQALDLQEQSLSIMEQIGDVHGYAGSLFARGASEYMTGNYIEAERYYRESYTYHHEVGNPSHIGWVGAGLAYLSFLRGDFVGGQTLAEEAIEISANLGGPVTDLSYRGGEAIAMSVLGHIANMNADYETALSMYQKAQPFARLASNFDVVSSLDWGQAIATCAQGDYPAAKNYLQEMLKRAIDLNNAGFMSLCLPVGAVILARSSDEQDTLAFAVQLLALADVHDITAKGWMGKWALLESIRQFLKEVVDEAVYQDAHQRGKALKLIEAVAQLKDYIT